MMGRGEHFPSKAAIVGLAAGITAYDVLCPKGETISEGFDRLIEKHPALTLGAIALVACHVANVFDKLGIQQLDPIHQIANLKKS